MAATQRPCSCGGFQLGNRYDHACRLGRGGDRATAGQHCRMDRPAVPGDVRLLLCPAVQFDELAVAWPSINPLASPWSMAFRMRVTTCMTRARIVTETTAVIAGLDRKCPKRLSSFLDRIPEKVGLMAAFAPGTLAECQTCSGVEFPERQGCAVKGLTS